MLKKIYKACQVSSTQCLFLTFSQSRQGHAASGQGAGEVVVCVSWLGNVTQPPPGSQMQNSGLPLSLFSPCVCVCVWTPDGFVGPRIELTAAK